MLPNGGFIVTQGDGWIPNDDDAPDAPPVKRKPSRKPRPPAPERPSGVIDITQTWQRGLARNHKEEVTKDVGNVALILSRDEAWRGRLRFNAFADRIEIGECPSLPDMPPNWSSLVPPAAGDVCSEHDVYVGLWLRRKYRVTWSAEACRAGLTYAARQHAYNPVTDYLSACAERWDRRARLDSWLIDHLGAEQSIYTLRVSSMWVIGAVARAFKPGDKVDHLLILEGEQGYGKTSALEILFGDAHFLPDLPDLRDKDAMHLLAGCHCALADELGALRSAASVERAKSFFTRRLDIYRPPYTRDAVRRPRSCVFAATTNAFEYLVDETGNRRYWPVLCTKRLDQQRLRDERDQLWGEAVQRYRAGEAWFPEAGLLEVIREAQGVRVLADEWEPRIARHVDGLEFTTVADCLQSLGIEAKDWSPFHQQRAARCLVRLGFEKRRVAVGDGHIEERRREKRWYPKR